MNPLTNTRGGVLVLALAALLTVAACRQKATNAECDQLSDRYAELFVREHFPDAGPDVVATERAREKTEAKTDVLKNCTSEVQDNELKCAMKATSSTAMAKCLE